MATDRAFPPPLPFIPTATLSFELDGLKLVNQDPDSAVAQWKQCYSAGERLRVPSERRIAQCVVYHSSPG